MLRDMWAKKIQAVNTAVHPAMKLLPLPSNNSSVMCHAKGNSRRAGQQQPKFKSRIDVDRDEQGVELFNISTGWNLDAMSVEDANNLLDDLEGWGVDSYSDDDDNYDDFVDVATVATVADELPGQLDIDTMDDEDDDDDDEDLLTKEFLVRTKPKKPQKSSRVAERDLLASLPAHELRKLAAMQQEATQEAIRLDPNVQRKAMARQRTHRRLKIVSGHAAGIRILSPQGDQTRPMMEMVRGAVFSMIASLHGSPGGLPEDTRWLDLFAGTGAVGIEALSRGCGEAHFVELSPWVTSHCLQPNLEKCGVEGESVVHTCKAEDFLRRALQVPRFAGGAFDFISVCPPYELVSYTELYDLLEDSPLRHESSIIVVEYPKKVTGEIRERIGPLVKLRDRRYGRTLVALYGPDVL